MSYFRVISAALFSLAFTGCTLVEPMPLMDGGGGAPRDDAGLLCRAAADAFEIKAVSIEANVLFVDVEYAGGCSDHLFRIGWEGIQSASIPPVVPLEIHHDAQGDTCEALVQQTLHIDLSVFTPPVQLDLLLSTGSTLESILYEESPLLDAGAFDLLPVEADCSFLMP